MTLPPQPPCVTYKRTICIKFSPTHKRRNPLHHNRNIFYLGLLSMRQKNSDAKEIKFTTGLGSDEPGLNTIWFLQTKCQKQKQFFRGYYYHGNGWKCNWKITTQIKVRKNQGYTKERL